MKMLWFGGQKDLGLISASSIVNCMILGWLFNYTEPQTLHHETYNTWCFMCFLCLSSQKMGSSEKTETLSYSNTPFILSDKDSSRKVTEDFWEKDGLQ